MLLTFAMCNLAIEKWHADLDPTRTKLLSLLSLADVTIKSVTQCTIHGP